ncbi:aminopeptidase N [Mycetocola reblochoni]|uniref:aminopeptidase N n=1 Tax=Mycetocola reblochoni TaxID=331618 RepID=UPI003F95C026
MPGENLTRDEAVARRAVVSTDSYDIALDLTTGPETFHSITTVRFRATPGASTFIDALTDRVHRVELNGVELDAAAVADGVRIDLTGLAEDNTLVVDADYRYTNTGEGLHRFVDPVDGEVYLYSQFEVPDSRRVFAVFEQPDLKAAFRFTVTAPSAWQVVSNSPTPEPVAVDDERSRWEFAPTQRISSYITALIAGPYAVERGELTSSDGRTIPLGVFARRSLAEHLDTDYILEKTRQGFAYFEERFDYPYPFEKYDQLFVPEYNAGAMENAGAVTFTEAYVFRSKVTDAVKERRVVTILHELAHMWFGDLVTMTWWNDLWLNESFAEWASTIATAEATEWTEAWTTFQAMEKSWAYRQDQLPSTHPIVANIRDLEDVQVNFDGITYAKGGSVLKQLVAWVGEDAFFRGVAAYFAAHAFGNTQLSDLLVELEKASGRDLSGWSTAWLETAGVNTLRPEISDAPDGTIASFAILQSAPEDYPTLRPHRLAIGLYDLVEGSLVRVDRIETDISGERTEIPELAGRARPALILINDDDLAYAKIRLDERSQSTATENLSRITDPLARALVWGAVWDAVRDAETPASEYIDLVLGNIAAETESTTLRIQLAQLQTAASSYVAPEHRQAQLDRVGDALLDLAREAAPGSDAQFQFTTAFAQVAHTEAQLDAVAALREGREVLDGLTVDTDLAWVLLTALAAGGRVDDAVIDAALAEDNTATGQSSAAQARAALPGAEAKARAWASVVDLDTLPNSQVRSTGLGFLRAHDPEDLAPYVDRYFAEIERLWNERSYKIAEYIVLGFYPLPLLDDALVEATRSWLSAHPEATALRRLVSEHLAVVERALAARERDARG